MAHDNLPPGVTPRDIDRHFGSPEPIRFDELLTISLTTTEEVVPDEVITVKTGSFGDEAEIVYCEHIEELSNGHHAYDVEVSVRGEERVNRADIFSRVYDSVSVEPIDDAVLSHQIM
jgi:hypothetical protein